MSICHVTIIGRDRPHLQALGRKLRVVVVGYVEDKRGAVVDAFMPENKIDWLRRNGCTVILPERIDENDRERQKQGRSRASTPFHPPYAEMRKVMREMTAGLLELCLRAEPV